MLYPKAFLTLFDDHSPVEVSLEAFNPFIPLDSERSGIPGIYFNWKIKNVSTENLDITLAFNAANLAGWTGKQDYFTKPLFEEGSVSEIQNYQDYSLIYMKNKNIPDNSTNYTEMAIGVEKDDKKNINLKPYWQEGQWWDGLQDFWNDFSKDGSIKNTTNLIKEENAVHKSPFVISTVGASQILKPGESCVFKFLISWYHPNRVRSWYQNGITVENNVKKMIINSWKIPNNLATERDYSANSEVIKNYYARWGHPDEVISYLIKNRNELTQKTNEWISSWFNSAIPASILDAVSATLTVIRSTTCFRVEDGKFFAWEGCFRNEGSCPGNCTHVWNYAQSLAYFFPELEQSMRETEYFTELSAEGKMNFRATSYLDGEPDNYYPASDGQLGTIIRVYREWMISGDNKWLEKLWPLIKLCIHFADENWDLDRDGVLEAAQHNTYDIEFYGVSTHLNSIWLGALEAYKKMALQCDDESEFLWADKVAAECAQILEEKCFNGKYYEQAIDDVNKHKYQYGKGCLADQVLGATWALLLGLPYKLDIKNLESAALSIYNYNFVENLRDIANLQRGYAFNDESGLVLCTWPYGGKPKIPFVYSDEVWTGIEYSVAALLALVGHKDCAEKLVNKVRQRYDGKHRNPWNEPECGNHYARSLASFGVYLAYCGFVIDTPKKTIYTNIKSPGEYFIITGLGWGVLRVTEEFGNTKYTIKSIFGDLDTYKVLYKKNQGGKNADQ